MGTRDAVVGARTEHKEDSVGGFGFGFGVQERSQESCCPYHLHLPHRHDSPSDSSSSFYGGPMFCASSNQTLASCLGDMYCHVGSGCSGGGSGASAADPSIALSSSGETGTCTSEKADALSAAQWQELERQTSIYRYMMASVPVPAELLIPISKNLSNSNPNAARGGSLKLGISSSASNSTDLEPWRCRRTDGKKWRCSRDVVPDQKYCERHSHKSRPRSRKPVELPPHIVNHNAAAATVTIAKNATDPFASHASRTYLQNPHFYGQTATQFPVYSALAPASSSYDHHRGLRWFMKEDDGAYVTNAPNPELRQMVQLTTGSSREQYSKFGGSVGFDCDQNFRQRDQIVSPSLGSLEGLLSLNQTHTLETRHFIDAWSKAEPETTNCALTLSVARAGESNSGNEEAENSQMGLWMGSPPGGPLAEALCLGIPSNARSISNTTASSCSRSSS